MAGILDRFVRRPDVEVAPMQEETILYHPVARSFCVLNPTAAHLWEQLAEPRSEAELAASLVDRFETGPGSELEADVRASLQQFVSLDLVVRAASQ